MTREEAIAKLKHSGKKGVEEAHCEADAILKELLKSIGYADVIKEYDKTEKWYG